MKAILIKTDTKSIEEVDFDGTLEHAYKLLDVTIIERVPLPNGDDVWVDEEGLINGNDKGEFRIRNYDLTGRGLITGNKNGDEGEEWADAKTTAAEAFAMVEFLGE